MEIDVQTAEAIEIDACLRTIGAVFRAAAFWEEIRRTLTPKFYCWKYDAPAGSAVVVAAKEGGRMASMLSAVPFHYSRGDVEQRGWQICDIATLPEFRGRGLYRRCLQALIHELPPGDLLICFPNRNSSHELFKQSFTRIAELTTFGRPILFFGRAEPEGAERHVFPHSLSPPAEDCLRVSKHFDYFMWRYIRDPVHRYFVHVDQRPGEPDAIIVMRSFNIGRFSVGLIMELHASNPKVQHRLIRTAVKWAAANRLKALLIVSSGLSLWAGMRLGFLPVPAFLTPKRHIVVGRLAGAPGELPALLRGRWHFHIGDWDGL